jgi:hypothetical protein
MFTEPHPDHLHPDEPDEIARRDMIGKARNLRIVKDPIAYMNKIRRKAPAVAALVLEYHSALCDVPADCYAAEDRTADAAVCLAHGWRTLDQRFIDSEVWHARRAAFFAAIDRSSATP